MNGYTRYWHAEARVPWLYNSTAQMMISYDDSLSIAKKGEIIVDQNLGGAMFWEFSGDRNGVLLSSIHAVLSAPDSTPRAPEEMTIVVEGNNIHLRWLPVTETISGDEIEITAYRVYASIEPDGEPEFRGSTSEMEFIDLNAVAGQEQFYYYITALRE